MSNIPPGWYDDPEISRQWRYWDGSGWTEHRNPKDGPRSTDSGSVWKLVPNTLNLITRHWRALALVAIPIIVLTTVGWAAVFIGLDNALNINLDAFLDRVIEPGFDPFDDPDDRAWWDAIGFEVSAGAAMWWVIAAVAFLASGLGSIAIVRLLIGAANGRAPTPGVAYAGALRRVPRLIGWVFGIIVVSAGLIFFVALLGVLIPLTLIITVPAVIALTIWVLPVVIMTATVITAGPTDVAPLNTAIGLLKGRWWAIVGRLMIVWIVVLGASIPISIITGPLLALSVMASVLVSTIGQVLQAVIWQAGGALIYLWAGGPVDPDLTSVPGAGVSG